MDQNIWEYDDFIFKGDELKGMTAKGKDKVKAGGQTDLVIPAVTPDGLPLKKIADNAFYRRGLTSVVIPDTVESIGYDAFGVCKLKEVKLPEALVNIEGFAFYRNKLTKVEFGSKVKRIEPSAFAMNELAEITLPETLEYIGASAFYKNAFETITFPKALTKIDMYAFRKNNIHKVEVANSVDLHKFAFESFTTVERL